MHQSTEIHYDLFQNNIKQESSIPTKFLPVIARSIKSEHSDERWQNTIPSKILAAPNPSFLFKRNEILCLKTQIRVLPAKRPAVVPASQKNRPIQKDSFPSDQSFTLLQTYFPIIISWRDLQVPRNNWAPALTFKRFAKSGTCNKNAAWLYFRNQWLGRMMQFCASNGSIYISVSASLYVPGSAKSASCVLSVKYHDNDKQSCFTDGRTLSQKFRRENECSLLQLIKYLLFPKLSSFSLKVVRVSLLSFL